MVHVLFGPRALLLALLSAWAAQPAAALKQRQIPGAMPGAEPPGVPPDMPQPTPEAMPQPMPQAEPPAAPQPMPQAEPMATPQAMPQPLPQAEPMATPQAMPQPMPQAEPMATPQAIPQPMPQAEPMATPQAIPQPMPQVTGGVSPSYGASQGGESGDAWRGTLPLPPHRRLPHLPHLPHLPTPGEILGHLRGPQTPPRGKLPRVPLLPPSLWGPKEPGTSDPSAPSRRPRATPAPVTPYVPSAGRCTREELDQKDVDIVLFGSTGFMGNAFADYITTHVQKPVRWIFAGRNKHKLRMQRKGLVHNLDTDTVAPIQTMKVDLHDSALLLNMTKRAKIVISTVGPSEVYGGEELIKQAIEGCSHYIDLAVETLWRIKMMKTYNEAAKTRGVVITQSAGMVSMVNDFLALYSAKVMDSDGKGPPDNIVLKVRKMNGMPTGGGAMSAELEKHQTTNNPYAFVPEARGPQRIDKNLEGLNEYGFSELMGEEVFFYPGARTEPLIIRRTLHQAYPKNRISLKHVATAEFLESTKSFVTNKSKVHFMPQRRPFPGEGPPVWIIKEGSWKMEVLAVRSKPAPRRTRIVVHGNQDPAVSATVRLCTSLALVLLEEGPLSSGYLTPASAVNLTSLKDSWLEIDNGQWMQIVHGFNLPATAMLNPDDEIMDQTPPAEIPVAENLRRRQMEDTAYAKSLADDGDDEVSKFMFSMMVGADAAAEAATPTADEGEAPGGDPADAPEGPTMPTGTLEEQMAEERKRPPWGHDSGKGWGAY